MKEQEQEHVFTSLNLCREWTIKGLDETLNNCFALEYKGELKCPNCGAEAKKYGFEPSRRYWKHIGGLSVSAQRPRVKCSKCGVRVINTLFARPDSRFTIAFEIYASILCIHIPVKSVAKVLGIDEKTVNNFNRHWKIEDYRQLAEGGNNDNTFEMYLSNLFVLFDLRLKDGDRQRVMLVNFNPSVANEFRSPEEFIKHNKLREWKSRNKNLHFFTLSILPSDIKVVHSYTAELLLRTIKKNLLFT